MKLHEQDKGNTMTWQTIDTAPKDGTRVLAVNLPRADCPHYTPMTVFFGAYHPNSPGKKVWREARTGHKVFVSHWMVLPDRPCVS